MKFLNWKNRMPFIRVGKVGRGCRLDAFLSTLGHGMSRTKIQKQIVRNNVKVNNQPVNSSKHSVREGDTVQFDIPIDSPVVSIRSVDKPVEVHFEDDHLLVVYKPATLVTHPSANHEDDSLVHRLFGKTDLADDPDNPVRPGIVHRLDKDTSGLLVIAKTNLAKRHLGEQFKNHSIVRKYLALIWGRTKTPNGMISKKLAVHPVNRLKRTVSHKGKDAVTYHTLIRSFNTWSILVCRLKTGRTHQIRVHLSSEGHPVIGDALYGNRRFPGTAVDGLKTVIENYPGQFLHAFQLGFVHPKYNVPLNFYRRPPPSFRKMAQLYDNAFTYQSLFV